MKLKYSSFLFVLSSLFIILLFPCDVFAAQIDSNKIQINSQELFWDGTNAQGSYESGRFNSTQNHTYQWGTSSATYKLFRFAPLINFTSLGVNSSYKARVAFYVFVDQPYSYDDKACSLFSGNGEKYSCTLYKEMDDQIGSSSSLLTFVYDFEWTSSSGYVEFWLNFDNFHGVPNKVQFMYTILDFQGNVSGNQIVLDSLGQTNKKLDAINDVLKDSFNKCYKNELKPFDFSDTSQNGISIKNNGNGTFTLNGTATDYTAFYMQNLSLTPNIYYTLSGGYNDGGVLQIIDFKNNPLTLSNGSVTFYNTESSGSLYLVVFKGTTLNNILFKPMLVKGQEQLSFVAPGKKNCINRIDDTNDKLDKLDKTLNDDNISGAKDNATSFFDDFKTDDFGLSGIITAPLSTIKSITSVSCSPLVLPLPFVNENLTLPCIRSIFEEHFSSLLLIYQTITTGILSYYIIVRLFNLVKDFKNPEHDEIEVMDL